jgi:hypothetical protein
VSRAASSAPAIATAATMNRLSVSMIGARRLDSISAVVAASSSIPSTRLVTCPVHFLEEAATASAMADLAATDNTFPLEEGGAAESGNHGPGKVVLTMV